MRHGLSGDPIVVDGGRQDLAQPGLRLGCHRPTSVLDERGVPLAYNLGREVTQGDASQGGDDRVDHGEDVEA